MLRLRLSLAVGFLAVLWPSPAAAKSSLEPVVVIVAQPDAPLSITSYNAGYRERSKYVTEGIHHNIKYKNDTDNLVVAAQFGFVSFSVFNTHIDVTNGVTIEDVPPGEDEKSGWVARAYSDFTFHTGIAFIRKVRFNSGEIWEVDFDVVSDEIRKIQEDFDASVLEEKPKDN